MADLFARVSAFTYAVLSPPSSHGTKRPAFFEDDFSSASLSKKSSLRSSQSSPPRAPSTNSPRAFLTPEPPSHRNSLDLSPIDLTREDSPPGSADTTLRKRRVSGPLANYKRRACQEAYRNKVAMNADRARDTTYSSEFPLSPDASSEASSFHLNSSINASTRSSAGEAISEDRVRNAQLFLSQAGEQAVQNITTGAQQILQHSATLLKLSTTEHRHRSRSDADRAERRRSVGHASASEVLEMPKVAVPVSSATSDHFLSPRAKSSSLVAEVRQKADAELQESRLEQLSQMAMKLEMYRKRNEAPDIQQITERVNKYIESARAKQKAAVQPDLAPLTPEENKMVDKALATRDDDMLLSAFNIDVFGRDIKTLKPKVWLNDEVINFYMLLLKEREVQSANTPNPLPKCHFCNSFFYTKLVGQKGYDYQSVRRWTMRVDLFALDKVILPINMPAHWCTAVINFKMKRFEYYDSLGGRNPQCLQNLRQYLVDEYADKKKGTLSLDDWTDYTPREIPNQENGYDCGVFCVKFADYCARDQPFLFTQRDIPLIRRRLVLNIVQKKAD